MAGPTAAEMATGVARRCAADWGVATTGVAGPEPQDGHPVGEVYVAVAHPASARVEVRALRLSGDRPAIREAAAAQALDLLATCLDLESLEPGCPTWRADMSVVRAGVASGAGYSLLMRSEPPLRPALLRELIGESLREERVAQGKTLREVSKAAQVSLGYLSEVERGQKEASSELLAAMCSALDLPLSVVLNLVSEKLALVESAADDRVTALPRVRALAQAAA